MKRRIAALLLCALLLCGPERAYAAAGGSDDPLISLSYIEDTFLPGVRSSLRSRAEAWLDTRSRAAAPAGQRLRTVELPEGGSLSLTPGQQLVLLSGSARLDVKSGTLLNVTAGRTSVGGDARTGNRYVLCGDCSVTVTASQGTRLSVSAGAGATVPLTPAVQPGACPFADVRESDWFYADVMSAWRRGFVNGMTESSYAPQDSLTVAQAVKLAACMHQDHRSGAVTLAGSTDGRPWYMSYADYALRNGILARAPERYDVPISRSEFVQMFYNALPETEFAAINLIMDGSIPDVATDAPIAREVYTFYAAGILTGFPAGSGLEEHAFAPDSTITRAEVATIMNRMVEPSARKRFTMD